MIGGRLSGSRQLPDCAERWWKCRVLIPETPDHCERTRSRVATRQATEMTQLSGLRPESRETGGGWLWWQFRANPSPGRNSLKTGNLQGISAKAASPFGFQTQITQADQWVGTKFPVERNREFSTALQGMIIGDQGTLIANRERPGAPVTWSYRHAGRSPGDIPSPAPGPR